MSTKSDKTETETTTTEGAEGTEMGKKLKGAGKKAEAAKAARRERTVKGSHLLSKLTDPAATAGLTVVDKSGFFQITGVAKGRKVYVAKKGGRVDFSGFAIDHAAVIQISETEARTKHLGKVRGMLNFDASDETVLEAYQTALEMLKEAPAVEEHAAAASPKGEDEIK